VPNGEHLLEQVCPNLSVRLIVALSFLVLNHAPLLVELVLTDGADEMSHTIGLEPEHGVERILRHRLEIIGAVEPRGRVEIRRTELLQKGSIFVVEVLGPLKHQVLEQMRESGMARNFILRADVIPNIDRDDRRLPILMDDQGEPVVELHLRIGYVNRLGACRDRVHEHGGAADDAGLLPQ
jgi:hypothetical protein